MKRSYFSILIVSLVLLALRGNAAIELPTIFDSNMVLQQQTDAPIWGKATPEKTVEVTTSWNNKTYSTVAGASGKWKLTVETPAAGGPYSITISDGTSVKLDNILIGEVWVCSGQSNMQMTMKGLPHQPIKGGNEAIATSKNDQLRLFTVKLEKSLEKKEDFTGDWKECIPGNVADFSATAYYFGRMIQEALGIPVGLISSSWGGTRIEPWISESGVRKFDWVDLPDKNMSEDFSQQTPTVLYNAMIAPMAGYAMKGAIWYQGESNKNEPFKYEKLLPGLADNWREKWNIGDFPFYYVQIAPFDYGAWGGVSSAYIREAMLNVSSQPNMGMACILDAGEKTCIHPANKAVVGKRLAYQALAKTYGQEGFVCSGPVLKNMNIEGSVVKLTFDHADYGLTSNGKPLEHFEIAGEDKKFVPAEAFITPKGVTVFSPQVEAPVAVRYAFKDWVVGELFNIEGLPASSFRTDDWAPE